MNPENPELNLQKPSPLEEESETLEEGAEPLEQVELTPELEAIRVQVALEQKTTGEGILSKLPEKLKRAFRIGLAALSLFAASGSFSKAEAGEYSFTGRIADQIQAGILDRIRGGFQRGEMGAFSRQQIEQEEERTNRYRDEERMRMQDSARAEEKRRFIWELSQTKSDEERALARKKHRAIMDELNND